MLSGRMMDRPLLIIDILRHAAEAFPVSKIVSRTVEGLIHRTTYGETLQRTARLAHALKQLGIGPGERVATLAWSTYRHFELYYAISGIGAVCHTVNPRLFADQLDYIVNHAGDRAIFVDLDLLPLVEGLADRCPEVRHVVIMTDREHMPRTSLRRALCYEDILEDMPQTFAWPTFDENTAAAMCYTSGTTGNPKGALYSHRSTVLHALAVLAQGIFPLNRSEVVMPAVPMFHVQAWGQPYAAPMCGASLVLPGARLDGESLHQLMESEGVTLALGVPTIWLGLLSWLRQSGERLSTLARLLSGGAAAPLSMFKAWEEEYGVEVLQGWGMTETSPVCACGPYGSALDGAADDERYAYRLRQQRLFGVELRVVGDDGQIVAADGTSRGELQCRGPWVISSYYNDEQASAAAFSSDGWFRTGDVATLAPESMMQVTDRTKDMIKSGGEWISSVDLENEVMSHPAVAEAAAIAMPHPRWQERPLLIIVLKSDHTAAADDIRRHLEGRISTWWVPDDIVFVDDLPHTATGKVSKRQLRERFRDHVLSTA